MSANVSTHPNAVGVVLPDGIKSGTTISVNDVKIKITDEMKPKTFVMVDTKSGETLWNQAAPYPRITEEQKKGDDADKDKIVLLGRMVTPAMASTREFPSWNDFKLKAHKPVDFELRDPKTPLVDTTPSGRKKALIIGLNYADSPAPISGAVNDAFAMRDFLLGQGFKNTPENMVLLFDSCPDKKFMPTKYNIIKALQWLVADAGPGDTLFLHFSGHSVINEDPQAQVRRAKLINLVPMDYKTKDVGMLPSTMLWDLVASKIPNGCRLIGLVDTPHYGWAPLNLPYKAEAGYAMTGVANPGWLEGDIFLFTTRGCTSATKEEYEENAKGLGGWLTQAFLTSMDKMAGAELGKFSEEMKKFVKAAKKEKVEVFIRSSQEYRLSERKVDFTDGIFANKESQLGKVMNKKQSLFAPITHNDSPLGAMLEEAGLYKV